MSRSCFSALLTSLLLTNCLASITVLAQILHQARTSYGCATRVRVVWTVQNIEQSIWTLSELLNSAKTAFEAGVELQIELYCSRGMSAPSPQTVDLLVKEIPPPPHLEQRRSSMASEEWNNLSKESPIADALNIIGGRPSIDRIVPRFVANAEGKSLVVGTPCRLSPLYTFTLLTPVDSLSPQLADQARWLQPFGTK